jgi:ribonuclease BN (tRNA processing enzyme)
MKIQFLGVGSAFCSSKYYQSNAVVHSDSGKKFMIDCGGDARFSMAEAGLTYKDIDTLYVSHCHADHIGGIEFLGFCRFFDKSTQKPKLHCERNLMKELWENSLRGGMECYEGKVLNLTDFFDCNPFDINTDFEWEGIRFTPVQTVHVMSGYKIVNSFGLIIEQLKDGKPDPKYKRVFFTTDTQFCPSQLLKFYDGVDLVFHDCETAGYKSGVHASYENLATLPDSQKNKMWLYHYNNEPKQIPTQDGFLGFAQKGQTFDCLKETV